MRAIQQNEASECGLACLAMISSHYNNHTDLAQLRKKFPISLKGVTLAQLIRHAAAINFSARPLRLELSELSALRLPCILHWDLNHFVVLKSVGLGRAGIIILDPATGERRLSLEKISLHFTGVALELTPSDQFIEKKRPPRISIFDLTGKVHGLNTAVLQIAMLSLALEAFAICAPLFNQFVVDEVIVSGDKDLLTVLLIGFSLLITIQTLISIGRSWFLMRWSMDVSFQWSNRIFAHLTKLPLDFFEKRHLGDIVSRFGSTSAIQSTLTNLFVESGMDALTLIATLVMMLAYSPQLTGIVVCGLCAYALIRAFSHSDGRLKSDSYYQRRKTVIF
jgi:ATP-binding cassette subfamily B protein RaxB